MVPAMLRLALVCFYFLLSFIASRHTVVEPVTWRKPSDDDVTLVQIAALAKKEAYGIVQRGPMEVDHLDPKEAQKFGDYQKFYETKTKVKSRLNELIELETDSKRKAWSRYEEELKTDTGAKLQVNTGMKLENKSKLETKTGTKEEVEMGLKLQAKIEGTKEEILNISNGKSDTKIQATRAKSNTEPEVLDPTHMLKLGGARKSHDLKMEVKLNLKTDIVLETKTKLEGVVKPGTEIVVEKGTTVGSQVEEEANIITKLNRQSEIEADTITDEDVKVELKREMEVDEDKGRIAEETIRVRRKKEARVKKDEQNERETKVKVESCWKTPNGTVTSVKNDAKTRLEEIIRAKRDMPTKRTVAKKGLKFKVKKGGKTQKEAEARLESELGVEKEVRLKLKAGGKINVNMTMNLKSNWDIETKTMPVLKTRGFPKSLTNAFKRTTSSLQKPGNVVDLGIRTVQPLVDWMKTTCKNLPVDYSFLTSAYRRLTSSGSGGEVRGDRSKNRRTRSPDLGLKTLVGDQNVEIATGRHVDASGVLVALETVSAKTPPPSSSSNEITIRNGNGNQHRNGIKKGNGVRVPISPPPSPSKSSGYNLPSKYSVKQEDTASDSDEDEEEAIEKRESVKRKKSRPRDDTHIEGYTLEDLPGWATEGLKDHWPARGLERKPESGPTLEERVKAQGAVFERLTSIEQSIKAAIPETKGKNGNGNHNQNGKVNGVKNGNGAPKAQPPSPPKTPSPPIPKTPPPSPKTHPLSPPKSPKQSLKERKTANGERKNGFSKKPVLLPSLSSWRSLPSRSSGKQEDTTWDSKVDDTAKKPSNGVGYNQGQKARGKASSSTAKGKQSPRRDDTHIEGYTLPELPERANENSSPWDDTHIEGYTLQELPQWGNAGSNNQRPAIGQEGKPESGLTFEERLKRQAAPFERLASIHQGVKASIPTPSSKLPKDRLHDPQAWKNLDNRYGKQKADDEQYF